MRTAALLLAAVVGTSACTPRTDTASSAEGGGARVDLSGTWLPDAVRAQAWPADLQLTVAARDMMQRFDPTQHDPTTLCMPLGTPRNMLQTQYPLEVVQTPQQVLLIVQPDLANVEVRRIPLDGSALPESPDPSWFGTSRGRWEGSTLVVETIGLRPDAPVSGNGLTHSAALRVIERFTLQQDEGGSRILVDDIELHDPLAYAQPLKTQRTFVPAPAAQVRDGSCVELQWIDKLWRDRLQEHADGARQRGTSR